MEEKSVQEPSVRSRRVGRRFFLILCLLLVFSAGFVSGAGYQLNRVELNLNEFWQVYSLIDKEHVGSIDKKKAVEGATRGLVESLGDPFSGYLTKEERSNLTQELSGEFEGIGARLEDKNSTITVVSPLTNSPAEKAGLKPNDVILKINGESTEDMSLDQAVDKIRGKEGTEVELTVYRTSATDPIVMKITRQAILVPSVTWKMIGSVGYIEVNQFGDDTVNLFSKAVNEIKPNNPSAIVIDLRNNPGGYLNDVAPLAAAFLPPASVVTIQKFKTKPQEEIRTEGVPTFPETKLFVLTNGGSASASEILAGALKDYGRAKIVGQKSYGKGSVQDIIPLGGGAALRLTIAEWLTPKGNVVNKVGIEPDIKVDGERTETADPVLDKALELAR
jgi:carboxyl-terminal processing protease